MTIALESQIVSSGFDKVSRTCFYTIEKNGERWTVHFPFDELNKKTNKQLRRTHIANALQIAMRGNPDPRPGTKADPAKPVTPQDFANLKGGIWYINPSDGKLYQKP